MDLLKTEFIKLTKNEATKNNRLFAAIDSGNTLTKIIFLNKCHKEEFLNDDIPTFTLQFSLFHKWDFESALQCIKMNAFEFDNNDYKIHVTGVNAIANGDKIKAILAKDFIYIDEPDTIINGLQIAVDSIGIENIIADKVDFQGYGEIENELVERLNLTMLDTFKSSELIMQIFKKALKSKFNNDEVSQSNPDSPYPILFCLVGSNGIFVHFDSNKKGEFHYPDVFGGKAWLGLVKSILDTNDYNEIVDLAHRGDRSRVDTIVKEMLDETLDSPYGKFPPYLPIFSLGKCADYNKGVSDFRREDIAQSLVSLFAQHTLFNCLTTCTLKKISKVYLHGNLFKSDIFQMEINKLTSLHPDISDCIKFLNIGYFGALGALFSD